jgi:hypothetical protein
LRSGAAAWQRPVAAPATSPPIALPVRYSATARRSAPLICAPCTRIAPFTRLSTIASGARSRSASGAGARASAAPLWQAAQRRWKIPAPSGD